MFEQLWSNNASTVYYTVYYQPTVDFLHLQNFKKEMNTGKSLKKQQTL